MKTNPYQPINGEIVEIIDESPTIKSFVIVPEEEFEFDTGPVRRVDSSGRGRGAIYSVIVTSDER